MNPIIRAGMRYQSLQMQRNDAPRLAAQPLPGGVAEQRGIRYMAKGRRHILDVYRPAHFQGPLPVLVDIHGGGLIYGDLDVNRAYCHALAAAGWLVIGIEYSLAPGARFFTQLRELAAGMRTVCRRAADWGGSLKGGVYLTGDSAGGLLALYLSALDGNTALRTIFDLPDVQFPANIRALGLVCPMSRTDVSPFSLMERELYGPLFRQKEFYPYMRPDILAVNCKLPPCWIQTGAEDFIRAHSLALAGALDAAGKVYTLVDLPKGTSAHPLGHVFAVGWPDWPESAEVNRKMFAFFKAAPPCA